MTSSREEGCSTPERQRQRKRDRRSLNAPWLGRSVMQSPLNVAVAMTRPPPPGKGRQQGAEVQVHSDSGTPKPPVET